MREFGFERPRGRGRRGGWGMGPHMWPPFFAGPGFRGGPRVRRGDVRAAALALLAEEPRNGYQIIGEIMERSGGVWRPSPGSVYPALSQLESDGLIAAEGRGGGRIYRLTEAGEAYVEEHAGELDEPWATVADTVTEEMMESRELVGSLAMAFMQVAHSGSSAQIKQAQQVLTEARRTLYRILADEQRTADERATDKQRADGDGGAGQ